MKKKEKISADELSNLIRQQLNDEGYLVESSGLTVYDKVVIGEFTYSESITLSLRNCLFIDVCGLYDYKPKHRTIFKDCYFLKGIYISELISQEGFVFNNCKVRGDFILDGQLKDFTIMSSFINNWELNIKADSIYTRGKESSYLRSLSIYNNDIQENIQLNNCIIENLNIGYNNIKSTIEIFNCQIHSVEFIKIKNNGDIKFLNCRAFQIQGKKSQFKIIESNLGKCEFFQFYFSSYDEVNIINSVLIDCLFINCSWTNNIKSYYPKQFDVVNKITSKTNSLKDEREVYKQIKYALSKQGDTINEHMFHGYEMNTFNKSLDCKNSKNWGQK